MFFYSLLHNCYSLELTRNRCHHFQLTKFQLDIKHLAETQGYERVLPNRLDVFFKERTFTLKIEIDNEVGVPLTLGTAGFTLFIKNSVEVFKAVQNIIKIVLQQFTAFIQRGYFMYFVATTFYVKQGSFA